MADVPPRQPRWYDFLTNPAFQIGAGIGSNVIGAILNSRAQGQQNQQIQQNQDKLYQIADEERARRDAMLGQMMPFLMRDMGMKNPRLLGAMYQGKLGSRGPAPAQSAGGDTNTGPMGQPPYASPQGPDYGHQYGYWPSRYYGE